MIEISSDYPPPLRGRIRTTGKLAELRDAIGKLQPGQSFVWPENKMPYFAAAQTGIAITVRKIGPEGYRVWLASKS